MPLPRIQDPSDEDEVQLLPIKSARSGRTLKPSAALKEPDNVANTIVEPALVIEPNARTVAKPTDFSSTEMVMNKESGGITAPSSSYELELMDEGPEVPQTPGEVIDLSSDCELVEGETEVDIEYD
ncbi:hypothetical protein JB92DRAFT_3141381 [Gautieria morchelliformis]|nr:hypothetical protein JB92DRAFT_3141381 [Gautieria morchelliformis]